MWLDRWGAMRARILGLLDTARFIFDSAAATGSDYTGAIANYLQPAALQLGADLREFRDDHEAELPAAALAAVDRLLNTRRTVVMGTSNAKGANAAQALGIELGVLRAEFDYAIADTECRARGLVARAYTHLNRQVMVDHNVRMAWQAAFAAGEVRCESLGAVHLLLHGLWAFKAHASGGRTDLVLNTPLNIDRIVRESAEAMILTEWKLVREDDDPVQVALQARTQMQHYTTGVLAGFEVAKRRYAVLVSRKQIDPPLADVTDGGIIYEHLNIAVEPATPSTMGAAAG